MLADDGAGSLGDVGRNWPMRSAEVSVVAAAEAHAHSGRPNRSRRIAQQDTQGTELPSPRTSVVVVVNA